MTSDDIDNLNIHILKIDSFTNNIYLSSPSQVLLNEDGMTAGGLRYTLSCFRKICHVLTPRLFWLLFDVASGADDNKTRSRLVLESTANPHVLAAINIFNRVVEDYFGRLEGCILMENAGTGNFDGFAMTDNKVFELGSIISIILSMFNSAGWNALHVFAEDRFIRLVFASSEKIESEDGYGFTAGAFVDINPSWRSNCISGCRTIIRTKDGVFTRRPVRSPPSRTFDAVRAAATVSTMLLSQDSHERFVEAVNNNINSSKDVPLGFSAKESGGSVSDYSKKKIETWMTRNGILQRHAKVIVDQTVSWGGSQEYALEEGFVSSDDAESRTWFDLAINMLRHADKTMGNQSDEIRHLANEILAYRVTAMEK